MDKESVNKYASLCAQLGDLQFKKIQYIQYTDSQVAVIVSQLDALAAALDQKPAEPKAPVETTAE